jgi:cytochrome c-type biogenesis protein CcmH/NrfG
MYPKSVVVLVFLAAVTAVFAAGSDEEVDAAYKKGGRLLEPFLVLSDRGSNDPKTPQARAQILEGIRLLSTVVEAKPDNWAAFWLIGKGHQSLRDHSAAQTAFQRSYAINPAHRDVARELVIESICTGQTAAAVLVAESIAKANPTDAGLVANLGLAHLANGQLAQARSTTERALKLAPEDRISRALLSEVTSIQNGRKPSHYCPR